MQALDLLAEARSPGFAILVEAAVGFLAALVTSIPMLGPVVLLLFSAGVEQRDAPSRSAARAVVALAIGAALAEGVHVALVVYGLGPPLLALPEIAVWLRLIAGLVLIGLAAIAWGARARERAFGVRSPLAAGGLGVMLVLVNPGFLVTWIAVVAAVSPYLADTGVPFVVGAVSGVLAWFVIVHGLARRYGRRLAARLGQLRMLVALGLAGLGAWLVVTAALNA